MNFMEQDKRAVFAALIQDSASSGGLKSVTFHSPANGKVLKVRGSLKRIGQNTVLQLESFLTEGRVSQENVPISQIPEAALQLLEAFKKADLADSGGSASLMISKKGSVTLLKKGRIGENAVPVTVSENNRQKNYLLRGDEPFLFALGVSDKNGRVHDKKQSKFRQICRFAEYIVEAEKKLKREGTLTVCDLCCGKSYLSFAAYHVLTAVCGRQVSMTCVDLKQSVMEYCRQIAAYSRMDGMHFICMDVGAYVPDGKVDLVISLHACDTATDMVLDFAARHGADAILATPCCQHQLYAEMNCPTLDFIGERPLLRQKFCAVATDALRLLKLEAAGYKTDATELIDPEDTPKNVMLRAYRRKGWRPDSAEAAEKRTRYRDTYRFLYGKDPAEDGIPTFDHEIS